MIDYQKWLDRTDNLLSVQRDRCLDLIGANFTRRELIELKMIIEIFMEHRDDLDNIKAEIDTMKRTQNSENTDYKTGFISALSNVEGYIAEIELKEM